MKNVGIQAVKLYEQTSTTTFTATASNVRCNTGGLNSTPSFTRPTATGATATTGGNTPPTSRSISPTTRSASSVRPCASSQRGDSGRLRRSHHTHSAPTPPITNIARQPSHGITSNPT